MPLKGGSPDCRPVDDWDGGAGWIAYPDEELRRASHALATDEGVWVVDPVDAPGVDDLLAEVGEVTGVVVCLDRHERDAVALARRHDVAVHVPPWFGVGDDYPVPVEYVGRQLGDTDYRLTRVRDARLPPWHEVALFDGETLYVPEAVGTAPHFRAPGERLGVHPLLRPTPPRRALGGLDPDRLLVGHGEGVMERAGRKLERALDDARRNAPSAYLDTLAGLLR